MSNHIKAQYRLAAIAGLVLIIACFGSSCARLRVRTGVMQYANPLDVSIADPQILKDDDGTYYLYGTTPHNSSEGFEVHSSRDLIHWRRRGWCYRKSEASWGKDNFWAPEVIKKDETYYLFYTAHARTAQLRSICVATAPSPLGPFVDATTPIMPRNRGFIDASPFHDPASGRYYLYALEENLRPPKIKVARLSHDLLSLDTPLTECLTVSQPWENNWIEAPFAIKQGDYYYLMYSGSGYASPSYAVGYAVADSPIGPWTKFERNPILMKNTFVSGPGHHSLIPSPDGSELFIAYHTHLTFAGGWQRQLAMDRIVFDETGSPPSLMIPGGPSHVPQPIPSGSKPMNLAKSDEFRQPLDFRRWHVFGEQREDWKIEDGALQITTADGDLFMDRTDGSNIFLQYAPQGDLALQTEIVFQPRANYEQAFLLAFQDQSNYIRVSHIFADGDKIEWAKEINGAFESSSIGNPAHSGEPIRLGIIKKGDIFDIFCATEKGNWCRLASYEAALAAPLQVGIGAYAPASKAKRVARFNHFRIGRNLSSN